MRKQLGLVKAFFIVLFFLALIVTLFSLIIPSRVVISRSKEIEGSSDSVMATIKNLNTWQNWFPAIAANKEKLTSIGNTESTITWMYNGRPLKIEVKESQPNAIKFSYEDSNNPEVENIISCFPVENKPNTSNVEWTAVTKLKWYPWEKFSGLFFEKVTGPGYEYGLAELDKFINGKESLDD